MSCYVAMASLKHLAVFLPRPWSAGITGMYHHIRLTAVISLQLMDTKENQQREKVQGRKPDATF